ncbi:hypothetical protein [Chamaesiphon minutus]|uniref:Uncharacterized protein n=1 Tax=Chamaesiphon minutus (strain ATCC 27169 / PCC 6605) TaxID=1173020 RepID=K9UB01_CHAP6|nr:hypothetical protein [Chamaesiphon minutus]AFY92262.1 hypothetical protein Cha6605_1025 [Chamaesiphon minutus PCC 6605]
MAQVDIDTTIAALQQGLTSIPAEQAIAVIESWQQQLQGNDLADDLGELKTALTSGKTSKGMSLAEILADIGADTTEASEGADPSAAAKVKQLGELLSQAAKSLT